MDVSDKNQDTLQWIIDGVVALRIRTFAIDHDIHIYRIGPTDIDLLDLALRNIPKGYEDVIERQHILTFENLPTIDEATAKIRELGIPVEFRPLIESYVYWSPDGKDYFSKSTPEEIKPNGVPCFLRQYAVFKRQVVRKAIACINAGSCRGELAPGSDLPLDKDKSLFLGSESPNSLYSDFRRTSRQPEGMQGDRMKNLILIMGMILLLGAAASAQPAATGVTGKGFKLGFDIASINTDSDELDEFLDSRVGFSGGVFLTYNLNRQFALQPEILYVTKGAEKDLFIVSAHWSIDYLEIPVLLKYDLMPDGPAHPNLFAGPAMDILLSSEIGAAGYSFDVADGMKSIDFGLVFGGGVVYKRVTFDVRYTLGLVNTVDADKVNELTEAEEDDFYYLEGDPSVKNTNISFMIGVRL